MEFLKRTLLLFIFIFASASIFAQDEVIHLKNPSFEGIPRAGGGAYSGISAPGWFDCGPSMFPGESPPDIHPDNIFKVVKKPQDGRTYIGLVSRENESWESVSQQLDMPLKADQCYSINLYLSMSDKYVNRETTNPNDQVKKLAKSLVLRIYGGLRPCGKKQLLAESKLISHTDWRNYSFDFEMNSDVYYITFEAFYKTPVLLPYFGNLLIDNISPITRIACPNEEIVAQVEIPKKTPVTKKIPVKKEPEIAVSIPKVIKPRPKKEKTITQELNIETITKGQTIKINNLYFKADTTTINFNSYSALNEVYSFLQENPKIRIEIGGHTNGIPKDEYCDKISELRSKAVATYLIRKGIRPSRLEFKGYGRRNPIASNKTKEGRKKNQRVEIKILSVM